MNPLITDDMVEIGALASVNTSLTSYGYDALPTLEGLPGRIEFCAEMRAALEAAAPLIAAKALRDVDEDLARAASRVDSLHHLYGFKCLCGFEGDGRKRTQTEHITYAMLEAYASVRAHRIEKS